MNFTLNPMTSFTSKSNHSRSAPDDASADVELRICRVYAGSENK